MRFLIDAQLPPALCQWLRDRGHEAVHVSEIGMVAASDAAIAARAEADGAVLVSKDEDFVVLRLPDRFALLWLRCGNATNRALSAWLEPRWARIEALLDASERCEQRFLARRAAGSGVAGQVGNAERGARRSGRRVRPCR